MLFKAALLPLLTLVLAGPIAKKNGDDCSSPTVTIYPPTDPFGDGIQITGISNASTGLDSFLGIPYAQPPTGSKRFQAPYYMVYEGDVNATAQPPACPQPGITNNTEDCLYLDVYRPTDLDSDLGLLPVLVWVHGGEFTVGDVSLYDPTYPMMQGIQTGKPFIFVSIQYRLGILGWAGGSEIANISAGNNGLKDITLALQWVTDNIWAWNGDLTSITVMGHSAGAVAVSLLYLGPDDPNFISAIMLSGSPSTFPLAPTKDAFQDEVDLFVELVNCTNATEGVIECLQAVPVDILVESQSIIAGLTNKMFWGATIDGYLVPGSPHDLLAAGNFSQTPFISGDVLDEGTYVAVTANVSSQDDEIAVANDYLPSPLPVDIADEIFELYPDDPTVGSPYGTGNDTFGYPKEVKQLASIFGDVAFHAPRRWFLEQATAYGLSAWSYSWEEPLPDPSLAPYGVEHGTDVVYFFQGVQGLPAYGYSDDQVALAASFIDTLLSFVYYGQPEDTSPGFEHPYWPAYAEDDNGALLRFKAANITIITDDFRKNGTDFFNAHATDLFY